MNIIINAPVSPKYFSPYFNISSFLDKATNNNKETTQKSLIFRNIFRLGDVCIMLVVNIKLIRYISLTKFLVNAR